MTMTMFAEKLAMLDQVVPVVLEGAVVEVRGLAVRVADLPAPVGALVNIRTDDRATIGAEVIGFDREHTIVMPIGALSGIRRGDRVIAEQFSQMVRVGDSLLGRVLDGLGRPIDGGAALHDTVTRPLHPPAIDPMQRPAIDQPLATGVRAVDAMTTLGRGQRIGVFAPPGVGKSTLLGMMARHTDADVSVIALVGERGREVRDFIANNLGERGIARSVVVCATSDEPPLKRIRAALLATSIAEYFRDQGRDVLLVMDSITRFCQAQRQVGLAAGEPPATKGYPPSVFSILPPLLERSGRTHRGSITGLYAVLTEGDEATDPIADAARGVLDGHILLTPELAHQGHYPAIDVLKSISRLAEDVITAEHAEARRSIVRLVNAYRQVEDLLNIGAYAPGSNADYDLAIAVKPMIDQLLQQGRSEVRGQADFVAIRGQIAAVQQQIEKTRTQLSQAGQSRRPQGPRG